jgi:hypothetical protein
LRAECTQVLQKIVSSVTAEKVRATLQSDACVIFTQLIYINKFNDIPQNMIISMYTFQRSLPTT